MKSYFTKGFFCLFLLMGISTVSSAQNKLASTGSDSTVSQPNTTPILAASANDKPQQQTTVQPKLAATDQAAPEIPNEQNSPAVQPRKD